MVIGVEKLGNICSIKMKSVASGMEKNRKRCESEEIEPNRPLVGAIET